MTTLKEKMKTLSLERQRRIRAESRRLLAEEMTLREVRGAQNLTQKELAKKLGVGQDRISKIEGETDLLLSTLQNYLRASGGELQLMAKFAGRPAVQLVGLLGSKSTSERKHKTSGKKPADSHKS